MMITSWGGERDDNSLRVFVYEVYEVYIFRLYVQGA